MKAITLTQLGESVRWSLPVGLSPILVVQMHEF